MRFSPGRLVHDLSPKVCLRVRPFCATRLSDGELPPLEDLSNEAGARSAAHRPSALSGRSTESDLLGWIRVLRADSVRELRRFGPGAQQRCPGTSVLSPDRSGVPGLCPVALSGSWVQGPPTALYKLMVHVARNRARHRQVPVALRFFCPLHLVDGWASTWTFNSVTRLPAVYLAWH